MGLEEGREWLELQGLREDSMWKLINIAPLWVCNCGSTNLVLGYGALYTLYPFKREGDNLVTGEQLPKVMSIIWEGEEKAPTMKVICFDCKANYEAETDGGKMPRTGDKITKIGYVPIPMLGG